MRIIGEIAHPILKITVFKHEGRFSIKFEAGLLEQTYKFRDDERLQSFDDIQRLVDEVFIKSVERLLTEMAHNKNDTMVRNLSKNDEDEFDIII